MKKLVDWNNGILSNKKFLIVSMVIFMSSVVLAGGILIFNAGNFETTITIDDNSTQNTYDVDVDGIDTPCTTTDTLTMSLNETVQIQHNIKNNENFAVDCAFTIQSISNGLSVSILDGTLTPTSTINVAGGQNKWVIFEYTTDGNILNDTDVVSCTISNQITKS